jgi:hypothetical protein
MIWSSLYSFRDTTAIYSHHRRPEKKKRNKNMLKVTKISTQLEAELFWEIRDFLNNRKLNGKISSTKANMVDDIYNGVE